MHAGISDISSDFEVIIDGPGGIPPGAGRIPIGMLRACCPGARHRRRRRQERA